MMRSTFCGLCIGLGRGSHIPYYDVRSLIGDRFIREFTGLTSGYTEVILPL